jgi:hypothetical protein
LGKRKTDASKSALAELADAAEAESISQQAKKTKANWTSQLEETLLERVRQQKAEKAAQDYSRRSRPQDNFVDWEAITKEMHIRYPGCGLTS